MLSTLLALIIFGGLAAAWLRAEVQKFNLQKRLRKYDVLTSKEDFENRLNFDIYQKQNEIKKLIREQEEYLNNIKTLRQKLDEVEEEEYVQSFGFYKAKYNFGSSEEYKERLEAVRDRQTKMIANDSAAVCHIQWEVEGSKRKGKKMINDFIKLILRAFNGECDAAVAKVKYNNAISLEKRIKTSFKALNKLSEINRCEITQQYLQVKLDELYLMHEFQEKKQEEAEEQRRIKEQIREEQRALREIEKAREEAEKDEIRYRQALEQARNEIEKYTGRQREKLEQEIEQLTQKLEDACFRGQEISRTQMTKSGSIYVLSNIGSFGENIYKIGMTRRLEPLERIRELSGASVPFPFDVHGIIFSENAPEVENLLHQFLREKSVNKVNERKEFFRVSLDEIKLALEKIAHETKIIPPEIKITKTAEAEQYWKTLSMERDSSSASNSAYTSSWDEDEELDEENEQV